MNTLAKKTKMITLIIFLLSVVLQTMMYVTPATLALALSSETDKLALLALKEKLTNGVPDSLPTWNESLHFCDWEGVTCGHRHMRVSVLNLENQNFGGTLGPALGNLSFLRVLILSNINLYGEIPRQVGRLKRLQVLDLSENNLQEEVPSELINGTNLQVIDLSDNQLTGNIPSWFGFGSMMQLTELFIGANNLVGTIPPSLGNISSLQIISLGGNQLEGSIPYVLGKLSNLKVLQLSENNLSGEIPHSLYNLSNIKVFDLDGNQLFGSLPTNIHRVFPILQAFFIGGNHFTGTFPSSISNLTELQEFDISWNRFNGPIPPNFGSLSKLQVLHIGSNNFGSGGAHDLDFLSSLTNCTQLQKLILDGNRFGGVLPDQIGNFSTNLNFLTVGLNPISGGIPERIGQLIGLIEFTVRKSFLVGRIPDSIGKLQNLGRLVLEESNLSGNIPITIGNLTMLSELYLHTNKLEGRIPFTLRYCTHLQTLSVYANKLSGDIPNHTFGYLEGLINLDLSFNSLTGPLPSEFGNLKQLSKLYLDDNKLSGGIPLFFSSLRSLEFLDLSNNNFSSTIPVELENLTLLNTLNLSFNHLYGEVPIGGVFSNVTAISVIGNKGLCGGIPQLKLPACSGLPSKKHKRSLKKKLILIGVIGVVLISFIAFISIYFLRRKPRKLSSSPSLQNRHLRVTYGELHQATNGFSSSNLVGTGSFGSVYRGSLLHFEKPIAVKVLNLETRGAAKSFTAQCKSLGRMKHRNLLRILTCCSSLDYNGEDFKAIVFEFMPNGSLENLLHGSEQSESRNLYLNLTQRVNITLDVAHALDYLHHDSEQVVVHCDVKPSNVLLDDDFVAHLGDFGLARLVAVHSSKDQVSSSIIKGTIGYVPPGVVVVGKEYGAGGPVSPQGDIYSYGILLLDMLTGKSPTNSMFGESLSLHKFCEMAIPDGIAEIVDSRLLRPFAEDQTEVVENNIRECLVSFARIGVACADQFPVHRMCMKDVILKLHEIKGKLPY